MTSGVQVVCEGSQPAGVHRGVVVENRDVRRAAGTDTQVGAARESEVAGCGHHLDVGSVRSEPVAGAVRGGVVDDDEERTLPSPLLRPQGLEAARQQVDRVPGHDDDRQGWWHRTAPSSRDEPRWSLRSPGPPTGTNPSRTGPASGSHRMTDARSHGTGWSRWVRGTGDALGIWERVVVVGYVVLVLAGITTSSVGSPPLLDDPSAPPGLIVGSPDSIRSDEFVRSTPWISGIMKAGGPSFSTPLTYRDSALVATPLGGPFTTLLYPDTRLVVSVGKWLPSQALAAGWWLPLLLVALMAPRWFRRFGAGPEVSLPLTVVLLVSPACVWWSWSPVAILAWALTVAVSAGYAIDEARLRGRPSWRGWLLAVVAGVGLGRLALTYQPWSIPLGASILIPTTVALVHGRARLWPRVGLIAGSVVVAGVALAGYFHEHAKTLAVLSSTAYPGERRFTGELVDLSVLLAGPHLWVSQTTPSLVNTNLSEAATGYTVLGVVALLLVPAVRWRRLDGRDLGAGAGIRHHPRGPLLVVPDGMAHACLRPLSR